MGSFIYFLGILAFNVGSQESVSQPGDGDAIGLIILNTILCSASSAIFSLIYHRFLAEPKCWDLVSGISGSFIGMVILVKELWRIRLWTSNFIIVQIAICAGCNRLPFWGSLVLGILSYLFYKLVKKAVDKLQRNVPSLIPLKID